MNPNHDIIARIDELVDHQLQQEPSGYDHNVNQAECPHCDRDWHGLPLTQCVAVMYDIGHYSESYSAADDITPVVCEGSAFIGPMKYPPARKPKDWFSAAARSLGGIAQSFDQLTQSVESAELVSFATGDGRIITGRVTRIDTQGNNTITTLDCLFQPQGDRP